MLRTATWLDLGFCLAAEPPARQLQGEQKKALKWRKGSHLRAHATDDGWGTCCCHLRLNNSLARTQFNDQSESWTASFAAE